MDQLKLQESGLEASPAFVDELPILSRLSRPTAFELSVAAVAPSADEPSSEPSSSDSPPVLANYIMHRPTLTKTLQLRSDPRFEKLQEPPKNDLLQEYGLLLFSPTVPSRDLLLNECKPIDDEQQKYVAESRRLDTEKNAIEVAQNDLTYRGSEYEKDVDAYDRDNATAAAAVDAYNKEYTSNQQAITAHNAEVSQYNAQCTLAPLDPAPFQHCTMWQGTLLQRKDELDKVTAGLNSQAPGLQQQLTSLKSRFGDLTQRKSDLDATSQALSVRVTKYNADVTHFDDWTTTFHQQWDFEVNRINSWFTQLDQFNTKLEAALNAA